MWLDPACASVLRLSVCVCVLARESLRMCIVFSSWLHSEALCERRLCAVSRPWARAVPLSISCLSVSAAIHTSSSHRWRGTVKGWREKWQTVRYIYWKRKAQSSGGKKRTSKGSEKSENIRNLRQETISIPVSLLQLDAKKINAFIEYQHALPSVADFPPCYLSPQRTPGSPASSRAWCATGHGWAPTSSWAPPSPTTATVATH